LKLHLLRRLSLSKYFSTIPLSKDGIDFGIASSQNPSKECLSKWSFLNLIKSFVTTSKFIGMTLG